MSREAEKLYEAAVALPQDERAALVMKLLDSIAPSSDAQIQESLSRLSALEAGTLDDMDDDAAMRLTAG